MAYELEVRGSERIEDRVRRLYEEISRTRTVVIEGVAYKVDSVTVSRGRGVVSGWEIIVEGDPSCFEYVLRDRDDRTYMTIWMKKPGIVLGLGLSSDYRHATIVYDT